MNYSNREDLCKMIKAYVSGTATREQITFLHKLYEYSNTDPDILSQLTVSEQTALENTILNSIRKKLFD